jgi:hypothetical protein
MQNSLFFVLVVGLATAVAIFRLKHPRKRTLDYTPDPNNRKQVLARGWSEDDFRKILADFLKLYPDYSPTVETSFRRPSADTLIVTFPQDVPDQLFPFLVNYAQYPRDFDLTTRTVTVIGKAVVSSKFEGNPEGKYIGTEAVFYSPANDTKYDEVYIQADGETFIMPFSFGGWKRTDDPRLPADFEKLVSLSA